MLIQDTMIQVRYAETDQMGIVYHANYFVWFEVGRTEWFKRLDQNYKSLEDQGVILPAIDVQCQYKKPALYDDQLIVRTHLHELKGVRLTFHYDIIRYKDGELLATGKTVHAFVDKDKKPVRLKKEFPQLWEALHNTLEKNE